MTRLYLYQLAILVIGLLIIQRSRGYIAGRKGRQAAGNIHIIFFALFGLCLGYRTQYQINSQLMGDQKFIPIAMPVQTGRGSGIIINRYYLCPGSDKILMHPHHNFRGIKHHLYRPEGVGIFLNSPVVNFLAQPAIQKAYIGH